MKKFTIFMFLILLFLTSIPAVSAIPSLPHVSVSQSSGYAPLNVKFTATNTASLTSFTWDFGDGKKSTIQDMSQVNTSHVYTQPGVYNTPVEFTYVYNGDDYRGGYGGALITVYPTADFSASPTTGNAPLTVKFKDISTGSPTSWSWNFGDGASSYEQNPVHTYSAAGDYTVILSVRYASGKSEIKSRYIVVNAPNSLVATFSASTVSGNAPLTVKFKDISTGSPTAWKWSFGDGTPLVMGYNPTHIYTKAGIYTVKETVSNSAGKDTEIKTNYINVKVSAQKPVAAFTSSPLSGKKPLTVKFTDKSKGSITSRSWNFGDKSTSTVTNPAHKYSKEGKYTVTLTVKNTVGSNTAKKTNYITVK